MASITSYIKGALKQAGDLFKSGSIGNQGIVGENDGEEVFGAENSSLTTPVSTTTTALPSETQIEGIDPGNVTGTQSGTTSDYSIINDYINQGSSVTSDDDSIIKKLAYEKSLEDQPTPTFAELFPSQQTDINKGTVTGAGMSVPIYAADMLFPYAMIDYRANALLRKAKLAEIGSDRITLKAPETFYQYQDVLSNNFFNDVSSIVNEEKAKGGNWYANLKDPNSDLMKTVRSYKKIAAKIKDYGAKAAEIETKLNSKDGASYYMSPAVREAISNFYNGYDEFATSNGAIPIDEIEKLGEKFELATNYDKILTSIKNKVKDSEDIKIYYGAASKELNDEAIAAGIKPDYTSVDWYNKVMALAAKKYLSSDRAENLASDYMSSYIKTFEGMFNDDKKLIPGSTEWNSIKTQVAEDIKDLIGESWTLNLSKLTTPETEWSKQAAKKYYEKTKSLVPETTGKYNLKYQGTTYTLDKKNWVGLTKPIAASGSVSKLYDVTSGGTVQAPSGVVYNAEVTGFGTLDVKGEDVNVAEVQYEVKDNSGNSTISTYLVPLDDVKQQIQQGLDDQKVYIDENSDLAAKYPDLAGVSQQSTINASGTKNAASTKTIVTKVQSKLNPNKYKITYSDGTSEIVTE